MTHSEQLRAHFDEHAQVIRIAQLVPAVVLGAGGLLAAVVGGEAVVAARGLICASRWREE